MLIHFNSGDKYNTHILQTVYFDENNTISSLIKQFIKTEHIINELNSFSISSYTFELSFKDKIKTYTFNYYSLESDNYFKDSLESIFKSFFDMEFQLKYPQPTFSVSDLIGWNFIDAFTHSDIQNRRFTFEKDGVIRQYSLSGKKGLKREYDFIHNGLEYKLIDGYVFSNEFNGNIYDISQALKGVVQNILISSDSFLLVTDKGKLQYKEYSYGSGIKLTYEPILFKCPFDFIDEEYYVLDKTYEKAQSLAYNETKGSCLSLNNPNPEEKWLKNHKVAMYFTVINKQTNLPLFDIYTLEKEYIHNGLLEKSSIFKETLDTIILDINSQKNFDFLKQFIYEFYDDFIEKYNNL